MTEAEGKTCYNQKRQCKICGVITYAVQTHHVSYEPEETIEVCANCHMIIHHPPSNLKDLLALSPKLRHYILLNLERCERGTWEKEEFERELQRQRRQLIEEEREFRYRRDAGLVCYKTATAETLEENMELIKHGWELVHEANGVAVFRKPLKEVD